MTFVFCKTLLWHSGRVLGGSSSINMMAYVRGSRHDFDAWEAMGCEGWGYDDVLPYFIKSEAMQDHKLAQSGRILIREHNIPAVIIMIADKTSVKLIVYG